MQTLHTQPSEIPLAVIHNLVDAIDAVVVHETIVDTNKYTIYGLDKLAVLEALNTEKPHMRFTTALRNSSGITELFDALVKVVFGISLYIDNDIVSDFGFVPYFFVYAFPIIFALLQVGIFLRGSLQVRAYTSFASCLAWLFLLITMRHEANAPFRQGIVLCFSLLAFIIFVALQLLVKRPKQNE